MNEHTHYFFAAKIPNETKQLMKLHTEKLKETLPFKRWVHHMDFHITLAFLGSAPSEKLSIAADNVQKALQESKEFQLTMNGLGTFGKNDSPRIFWVDTKDSNELKEARNKVFTACLETGFQLETRPFKPHITLARKWTGDENFQTKFLDVWNELQSEPLKFTVNEIVLYQTHLDKIPKYEEKTIYHLG